MHGPLNDAMAVYVNTPACALTFVAQWLVPGVDPPGIYRVAPGQAGEAGAAGTPLIVAICPCARRRAWRAVSTTFG
jgi:hypothetical protein